MADKPKKTGPSAEQLAEGLLVENGDEVFVVQVPQDDCSDSAVLVSATDSDANHADSEPSSDGLENADGSDETSAEESTGTSSSSTSGSVTSVTSDSDQDATAGAGAPSEQTERRIGLSLDGKESGGVSSGASGIGRDMSESNEEGDVEKEMSHSQNIPAGKGAKEKRASGKEEEQRRTRSDTGVLTSDTPEGSSKRCAEENDEGKENRRPSPTRLETLADSMNPGSQLLTMTCQWNVREGMKSDFREDSVSLANAFLHTRMRRSQIRYALDLIPGDRERSTWMSAFEPCYDTLLEEGQNIVPAFVHIPFFGKKQCLAAVPIMEDALINRDGGTLASELRNLRETPTEKRWHANPLTGGLADDRSKGWDGLLLKNTCSRRSRRLAETLKDRGYRAIRHVLAPSVMLPPKLSDELLESLAPWTTPLKSEPLIDDGHRHRRVGGNEEEGFRLCADLERKERVCRARVQWASFTAGMTPVEISNRQSLVEDCVRHAVVADMVSGLFAENESLHQSSCRDAFIRQFHLTTRRGTAETNCSILSGSAIGKVAGTGVQSAYMFDTGNMSNILRFWHKTTPMGVLQGRGQTDQLNDECEERVALAHMAVWLASSEAFLVLAPLENPLDPGCGKILSGIRNNVERARCAVWSQTEPLRVVRLIREALGVEQGSDAYKAMSDRAASCSYTCGQLYNALQFWRGQINLHPCLDVYPQDLLPLVSGRRPLIPQMLTSAALCAVALGLSAEMVLDYHAGDGWQEKNICPCPCRKCCPYLCPQHNRSVRVEWEMLRTQKPESPLSILSESGAKTFPLDQFALSLLTQKRDYLPHAENAFPDGRERYLFCQAEIQQQKAWVPKKPVLIDSFDLMRVLQRCDRDAETDV